MSDIIDRNLDDPDAHYDTLCRVTGQLFLSWARLETNLAANLRQFLTFTMTPGFRGRRFPYDVSAAIFGSARFKTTRTMITDLVKVTSGNQDVMAFLNTFFTHLGNIEDLRNKLAHQTLTPTTNPVSETWQLSDFVTTKHFGSVKRWTIAPQAIHYAAQDTVTAGTKFLGILVPHVFDRYHTLPFNLEQPPWLYKPSMLALQPRKRGPSPQVPPPPPPPSAG